MNAAVSLSFVSIHVAHIVMLFSHIDYKKPDLLIIKLRLDFFMKISFIFKLTKLYEQSKLIQ